MKNGAEMAVADVNAAGGVLGKKVAIDIEDDACDAEQARSVAERIGGMRIPFVAGHYCSSSSIPASEVSAESAADHARIHQSAVHGVRAMERRAFLRPRRPAGLGCR